jgi:hypothetical protein
VQPDHGSVWSYRLVCWLLLCSFKIVSDKVLHSQDQTGTVLRPSSGQIETQAAHILSVFSGYSSTVEPYQYSSATG